MTEKTREEKMGDGMMLAIARLGDMTADRNEWRTQHENLLAMYSAQGEQLAALRATHSAVVAERDRMRDALREAGPALEWAVLRARRSGNLQNASKHGSEAEKLYEIEAQLRALSAYGQSQVGT